MARTGFLANLTFRALSTSALFVMLLCSWAVIASESASYVGTEQCISCHQTEHEQWKGSHHDMAMSHMDVDVVLGDFDDASLEFAGKTNRFYRKDEKYFVHIEGPDGKFYDYQISYTFGFEPLQQYMVEFDDGRIQLIPFAWDSRPQSEGGQRWFHLYPEFTEPDHEFYWTNVGQNWNFMCADCHSTDVKKNYDLETNTYSSSWFEVNVGCEACHGPASEHILWTQQPQDVTVDGFGFDRELGKAVEQWVFTEGEGTLQPNAIHSTDQVTMCAQCHSRRTQLGEENDHVSGSFSDRYRLNLLEPALYHADGQIFDEDYVYGSFLQSKMAEKGVVCSNCHNPHTAELIGPEQAVCSQCHLPTHYNEQSHSRHQADTEAAQCTTCHMPETTYMQVDPRRDHSWQVPRPDLSLKYGTPNVCVDCHKSMDESQDNQWAVDVLKEWYPQSSIQGSDHFAEAFTMGEQGHAQAGSKLSYVAQDFSQSAIVRASALERIANYPSQNALVAAARGAKQPDELIRIGAIGSTNQFPLDATWRILEPLLTDPVLAVRIDAAGALSRHWRELSITQREALTPALDEYIAAQKFNADRAAGRVSLGNIYTRMGRLDEAEKEYQQAILVEPYMSAGYVNLADLYRMQQREADAQSVFEQGIAAGAADATLHYAFGLNLVRQKAFAPALSQLKLATNAEPANAQYWYVSGVVAKEVEASYALEAFSKAFQISGQGQHLFALCEVMLDTNHPQAKRCIDQLATMAPANVVQGLRARLPR